MSLTFALIVVILATIVVSVAFIAGILTQVTRLPKLIFYILAGMILGPIGFGLIQPAFVLMMEGQLLQAVVALAVAIIVFEGGYNFNRCLPHEQACAPISFRMLLGRILRLSLIGDLSPSSL